MASEAAAATALDPHHPVRRSAFPPGEFVGQQSLVSATEIRTLARAAGIQPGVSVLDLCCGAGGPGSLLVAELACTYLGVDADPAAVALARTRDELRRAAPASRSAGAAVAPRAVRRRAAPRDPARVPRQASAPRRDLGGAAGRWPVRLHARGGGTAHRGGAGPDAACRHGLASPGLGWEPTSRRSGCESAGRPTGPASHRCTADALAEAYVAAAEHAGSPGDTRLLTELATSHRLWAMAPEWARAQARLRRRAALTTKRRERSPGGR